MLAGLKLYSQAVPGLESVSSPRTRTKGPLLKEAVVLALGKAQLGFVVAARPLPLFQPHFGPDLLHGEAAVNRTCQALDRRAKHHLTCSGPGTAEAGAFLGSERFRSNLFYF